MPSRHPQPWRHRRLPLGPRTQAGHDRLGKRARNGRATSNWQTGALNGGRDQITDFLRAVAHLAGGERLEFFTDGLDDGVFDGGGGFLQ